MPWRKTSRTNPPHSRSRPATVNSDEAARFSAVELRQLLGVAALLLVSLGTHRAQSQEIKVEYNPKENFTAFKDYSWITQDYYQHPLLALNIMGAVDEELQAKGLKRVEHGGDLIVAAYGAIDSDLNVAYRPEIYSMPGLTGPVWWADGTWVGGSSSAVYIKQGTLVVDIADPHQRQLKWRGIAHMKLDPKKREKNFERVNKAIEKMFRKYP